MFTPEAVAGYTSTALFTIINLLVTYFVLYRFLFKPIMKVLRTRQENLALQLKESETKEAEATRLLTEANRRIQQSAREAGDLVAAARSQAEVQSESILSEARREAVGMVTRADGEIARMRTTMINEVRDEVADLSVAIASKVIGQVMDQHQQRALVEQFLDDQMDDMLPASPAAGGSGASGASATGTPATPGASATGTPATPGASATGAPATSGGFAPADTGKR